MAANFNNNVEWFRVLPLLGTLVHKEVLPFTTQCVIGDCGGNLTIYYDDYAAGTWAHCTGCKFAGDIIELAAAHWQGLDIATTVQKLLYAGVVKPEVSVAGTEFRRYMSRYIERRKRFNTFWLDARIRLASFDHKGLRRLQHKLGLRLGLDYERWLSGPGLFVGGAHKTLGEAAYSPLMMANTTHPADTASNRVFNGRGWTDTLVIPLHDLPGRLKGFIFIGRDGILPKDMVFRIIKLAHTTLRSRFSMAGPLTDWNCGLALYEALNFAGDSAIIMDDPILALQLQCWYLQDDGNPAPIASIFKWKEFQTSPAIWANNTKKLTFWGRPTPLLFAHAKAAGAKVCLAGFTTEGPMKSFRRTPLREWMQRIDVEAKPWDIVLEEQLSTLPTAEAETILVGMQLSVAEREDLMSRVPQTLRDRLAVCQQRISLITMINKHAVREDSTGWHVDKTNELIANGVLRIDQVVTYEDTKENEYVGRIQFRGNEIPFHEKVRTIETNPFAWMRQKLFREQVGFFDYNEKWEARAIAIAMQFHPPEVVSGFEIVGWNSEAQCFVFPQFLLKSSGEVDSSRGIKILTTDTPARRLAVPTPLSGEEVKELTEYAASAPLWAIVACVASNILKPIFTGNTAAIGLVGKEVGATGHSIARALGCATHCAHTIDVPCNAPCNINKHNWPVVLYAPSWRHDDWMAWLAGAEQLNFLVSINWYAAQVFKTLPGWHIVDTNSPDSVVTTPKVVSKLVPAFLQYVAQNRFKLPTTPKRLSFVHTILTWIHDWFTTQGGSFDLAYTSEMITADDTSRRDKDTSSTFLNLLCRFLHDGELGIARTCFMPVKKAIFDIICIPGKNGQKGNIFVPKVIVNRLLVKHGAPLLDATVITRAVHQLGGVVQVYRGLPGWLIPESVWDKHLDAWTAQNAHLLYVANQ